MRVTTSFMLVAPIASSAMTRPDAVRRRGEAGLAAHFGYRQEALLDLTTAVPRALKGANRLSSDHYPHPCRLERDLELARRLFIRHQDVELSERRHDRKAQSAELGLVCDHDRPAGSGNHAGHHRRFLD